MKCKSFRECIQPHICGPSTACIWGADSESSEALELRDKNTWNAAIEAAASVDALGMNEYLAKEIRKLKK